jgi:hypothetical protein
VASWEHDSRHVLKTYVARDYSDIHINSNLTNFLRTPVFVVHLGGTRTGNRRHLENEVGERV